MEPSTIEGVILPTEPVGGGDNMLDVTQAPNGNLVTADYETNSLSVFVPIEPDITSLRVVSLFPRRGPVTGGTRLMVFGNNFVAGVTVTMGGKPCTSVVVVSSKKIECTIPFGTVGPVDVTVSSGASASTFTKGYRYIRGIPAVSAC